MARVTPVHYKGKMWCVKVRTGAFVARRHGKIFITGNSGFPKSMDVSKAIDKALGAERKKRNGDGEHLGNVDFGMKNRCPKCGKPYFSADPCRCPREDKVPVTDQANEWQGWGTCLKPAWEPIIVARKPLDGTVAHNVMTYGTGAINIDGCRVPINGERLSYGTFHSGGENGLNGTSTFRIRERHYPEGYQPEGRFPANLVHDGSQEVLELFPETSPSKKGKPRIGKSGNGWGMTHTGAEYDDMGTAARFFYCAKASKADRGEGNDHPTVKPNALMRWLVRLVCPQGGTVLDPFMGSGSTGVACIQEGMRFVGIDMDEHYCEIAEKRIGTAR